MDRDAQVRNMVGTRVIESTDTLVKISTGGRIPVSKSDTDTKTDPSDPDVQDKRAVELTILLQAEMDTRILEADLPRNEVVLRFTDQEMQDAFGERMFFETIGLDRFLVSREDIITVTWNGIKFVTSIRVTR